MTSRVIALPFPPFSLLCFGDEVPWLCSSFLQRQLQHNSNDDSNTQVNALLINAYNQLSYSPLFVDLSSPRKSLNALIRLWCRSTMAALAIAARSAYQQSFDARPYTTLAATNGALSAIGDVVAQASQILVSLGSLSEIVPYH
jgi:hypothetical protein